jgi:hypothetical protein
VTKNILSQAPPCFARYVESLVPAVFAVVSTHQSALGPRGGLWPVLLCVIYKEGLYLSSSDINRLMMMMAINYLYVIHCFNQNCFNYNLHSFTTTGGLDIDHNHSINLITRKCFETTRTHVSPKIIVHFVFFNSRLSQHLLSIKYG